MLRVVLIALLGLVSAEQVHQHHALSQEEPAAGPPPSPAGMQPP